MFCSKCGKENANDAKFCASCGAAVTTNTLRPACEKASSTKLIVDFKPMGTLMECKVEVLLDGKVLDGYINPGQFREYEIAPGEHNVSAVLYGLLKRGSNSVEIVASANSTSKVEIVYSKLWGNLKVKIV